MHCYRTNHRQLWTAALTLALFIGLAGSTAGATSKDKSAKTETGKTVGIYLLGHTPLPDVTVSDITPVIKPDRQLIQLTDNVHGTIILLDVGNPKQPKVLEKIQLPGELAQSYAQTRIGNATLLMVPEGAPAAPVDPQAVTLLSFADPSNPTTLQTFKGVTALWTDPGRELIYLTNGDGLWVLEIYSVFDKEQEEHLEHRLYEVD
jgi:hypothetical protein